MTENVKKMEMKENVRNGMYQDLNLRHLYMRHCTYPLSHHKPTNWLTPWMSLYSHWSVEMSPSFIVSHWSMAIASLWPKHDTSVGGNSHSVLHVLLNVGEECVMRFMAWGVQSSGWYSTRRSRVLYHATRPQLECHKSRKAWTHQH